MLKMFMSFTKLVNYEHWNPTDSNRPNKTMCPRMISSSNFHPPISTLSDVLRTYIIQ